MSEAALAYEEQPKILRFTRAELDAVLTDPDHKPEQVLDLLERNFNGTFSADAGVAEKYSLRKHTLMVMEQFHKYFGKSEIRDKQFFEFLLAIHDIGKPEAVAMGDKRDQHHYTNKFLSFMLHELEYTDAEVALAQTLLEGDTIGLYLRFGKLEKAANDITDAAERSGVSTKEFFNLLIIYHMVDAASYTTDAGALGGLDFLFSFDSPAGTIKYAPKIAEKIDLLRDRVLGVEP